MGNGALCSPGRPTAGPVGHTGPKIDKVGVYHQLCFELDKRKSVSFFIKLHPYSSARYKMIGNKHGEVYISPPPKMPRRPTEGTTLIYHCLSSTAKDI